MIVRSTFFALSVAAGLVGVIADASAQSAPPTQQAQAAATPDWGAISGSVAGLSDYVFRGISQTRGGPAVQGALEYTKEIGPVTPYVGTFASNTRFPDTSSAGNLDVKYEVDLYGGIRVPVEKAVLDFGYIRYYYPGADMPRANSLSFDFSEVYFKPSYDFGVAKLSAGWWHSQNFQAGGGKSDYFAADVAVPTPLWDINATGHIGRLKLKNEVNWGYPDYTDWALGVNRDFPELLGVNISLNYYDTNIKRSSALKNSSDNQVGTIDNRNYNTASPRIVLGVSKTF